MHKFLDQPVEMTIHNLVGRCARECLHLLNNKSLLRPCQCDPSIVPNTGRSRVIFVLQFVPGIPLLTPTRIISSTKVAREAVLVVSMPRVARVARVTEVPFSTTHTVLALRLERGSGPKQWKARVPRLTRSSKSSIVLMYAMATSTRYLYLVLGFGRLLTVHKITSKEVSK